MDIFKPFKRGGKMEWWEDPRQHFIREAESNLTNDEYDDAIRNFSEAIKLDPENLEYWSMRAMAFARKGDIEAAVHDFTVRENLWKKYKRPDYVPDSPEHLRSLAEHIAKRKGHEQIAKSGKGVKLERPALRTKEAGLEKKRLEQKDERLLVFEVIADVIKSGAPLLAEDFDNLISELIKKHFPEGVEKNEEDVERINLEVKKELLDFRHKKYEGDIQEETAKQVAGTVLAKIESNFREHKYKNDDIKTLFKDILYEIEQELGQRNLNVSNENLIQVFSKIVEEWSANPQRTDVSKSLVVSSKSSELRPASTALVKDLAVDEFFDKIKEIKDARLTPTSQFQIAERMQVDLNFSLINVDFKLSASELLETFYGLLKKLISRGGR